MPRMKGVKKSTQGGVCMPKLPKRTISREEKMERMALSLDKAIDKNDYENNM